MDGPVAGVLVLTLVLAAANGANDISKGVATLAGAGVTRYKTALLWGSAMTLGGALCSSFLASKLAALFSSGIVSAQPTVPFALAVLLGTIGWVGLATLINLPVSTTHAIVGSLIGAGIQLAEWAVNWGVLFTNVATPLLMAIAVSYGLSTLIGLIPIRVPECVCLDLVQPAPSFQGARYAALAASSGSALPLVQVSTGSVCDCSADTPGARRVRVGVTAAHWFTSGATSFARGLNDTPKIVAISAFALTPAGVEPRLLVPAVGIAMITGGLLFGLRIARVMAEKIVTMSHVEGFQANLATSLLVGFGANLGLPLSTTHVSTGAIAGVARGDVGRLNRGTLRDFALAWTATPITAALIAAAAFALLRG